MPWPDLHCGCYVIGLILLYACCVYVMEHMPRMCTCIIHFHRFVVLDRTLNSNSDVSATYSCLRQYCTLLVFLKCEWGAPMSYLHSRKCQIFRTFQLREPVHSFCLFDFFFYTNCSQISPFSSPMRSSEPLPCTFIPCLFCLCSHCRFVAA